MPPSVMIPVALLLALSFFFWLDKLRLSLDLDNIDRKFEEQYKQRRAAWRKEHEEHSEKVKKQRDRVHCLARASFRCYQTCRLYEEICREYVDACFELLEQARIGLPEEDEEVAIECGERVIELGNTLMEGLAELKAEERERDQLLQAELKSHRALAP